MMAWFRRDGLGRLTRKDWKREAAQLGRQLGQAQQRNRQLEADNEQLSLHLSHCNRVRLGDQAKAAAAEKAAAHWSQAHDRAVSRIDEASKVLARGGDTAEALQVLQGGGDD